MPRPSLESHDLEPAVQDPIHKWLSGIEVPNKFCKSRSEAVAPHQALPVEVTQVQEASMKAHPMHNSEAFIDHTTSTPRRRTLHEKSLQVHQPPISKGVRRSPMPAISSIEQRSLMTNRASKHGYERRPRHKTKEDRYEYKGSSSGIQRKQSSRKSKRSSKQIRRHTINDNFHASNVSRDRLTLRSYLNLGIFRRGKASSPVKSHDLRDFPSATGISELVKDRRASAGFSETKFLSKRCRDDNEEYSSHRHKGKKRKTQTGPEDSQQFMSNYFSLGSPKDVPRAPVLVNEASCSLLHSTPNPEVQTQAASARHAEVKKRSIVESRPSIPQSKRSKDRRLMDQSHRRTPPSSTVFTWSCSSHPESTSESLWDFYRRQLLQFNLGCQDEMTNSNRKYWSLEELKALLQEREKFWNREIKGQPAPESLISVSRCNKHKPDCGDGLEGANEGLSEQPPGSKAPLEVGETSNDDKASLDREFIFPGLPEADPNIEVESQHKSYVQPIKNDYHYFEELSYPDSIVEDQNVCFSPSLSQVVGALEQEKHQQNALGSVTDCFNVEKIMAHAEEAQFQTACHETFSAQALDAAYAAIVHSEQGSMCGMQDYGMEVSSRTLSNESIPLRQNAPQGYGLSNEPSVRYVFGSEGGMSQNARFLCGMTDQVLGFNAMHQYGMSSEFIGIPRDFWRQNKLY